MEPKSKLKSNKGVLTDSYFITYSHQVNLIRTMLMHNSPVYHPVQTTSPSSLSTTPRSSSKSSSKPKVNDQRMSTTMKSSMRVKPLQSSAKLSNNSNSNSNNGNNGNNGNWAPPHLLVRQTHRHRRIKSIARDEEEEEEKQQQQAVLVLTHS